MQRPYVVLDVGSGYTKVGFAGNLQPTYTIPTVLATRQQDNGTSRAASTASAAGSSNTTKGLEDLDYFIGEDALNNNNTAYNINFPVRQSNVEDWDAMERYYQQCLFQYLRVDPEDHCVLCTEAVGTSNEARQQHAEIMFETFGVAGLYQGVSAILSLYTALGVTEGQASLQQSEQGNDAQLPQLPTWQDSLAVTRAQGLDPYSLTGVVVDVGEGSSSVVPVMDGFVVRSGVRSIGVGGRDVTSVIQQALRSRNAGVPPEMSWEVSRKVKESYCYACSNPHTEPGRLAQKQAEGKAAKKTFTFEDPRAGNKKITVTLESELYMAPELFFSRDISATSSWVHSAGLPQSCVSTCRSMGGWQPLPKLVDTVVQTCPIDARRPLYNAVALSGGTTCIKNFARKMQVELMKITNERLPEGSKAVNVNVMEGGWAPHAAWLGGSLMAGGAAPAGMLTAATTSREHWQEHGTLLGAGLLD